MTDHPITPPPELVEDWAQKAQLLTGDDPVSFAELLCNKAARWGADQELEACCEWVSQWRTMVGGSRPEVGLRAARRPKPPSLAEEAHDALGRFFSNAHTQASQMTQDFEILRRAVERLQELENNG